VTQISLRVHSLAENETITDEALAQAVADAADRLFAVRIDGRMYEARAVDAFVRDGWIVVATEIDADISAAFRGEYSIGPMRVATVLDEPPLPQRPASPPGPDWSTVPGSVGGPARFERTLDQGLAPVAAERWWFDRKADASHEWLVGPEFRWVSP
jgi:hypothetical protein